jgi:hypothetical protein
MLLKGKQMTNNLPIKKVDDSLFEGKSDPTQYDYQTNTILVKSSYDVETDPEGWIVHESIHHKLKDVKDDGKPYPTNNIEKEAYMAQFKVLSERGHFLYEIKDVNIFPTLSLKFKNEEYVKTLEKYWRWAKKYFNDKDALKFLLEDGCCFVNYRPYICPCNGTDKDQQTIVVFLSCSDTFGYSVADGEDISNEEELEKLYNYVKKDQIWGSTNWVIEKRKQKPIEPVIEKMKKLGIWKPEYESYA